MHERTSRRQQVLTYALAVIGILGIGFLSYIVVDHFLFPPVAIPPEVVPEIALPDRVVSDPAEAPGIPIGIRINQRAPDFRLRTLEDRDVALSDFLGKVVILDFWASWCGPCQLTMPGLETIARTLAPEVVLLGVSLDRSAGDAADYLKSHNYEAIIALYGSYASAYGVFLTYGGGGIPKTYVLDRNGIIRYVGHPARLSQETIDRLL